MAPEGAWADLSHALFSSPLHHTWKAHRKFMLCWIFTSFPSLPSLRLGWWNANWLQFGICVYVCVFQLTGLRQGCSTSIFHLSLTPDIWWSFTAASTSSRTCIVAFLILNYTFHTQKNTCTHTRTHTCTSYRHKNVHVCICEQVDWHDFRAFFGMRSSQIEKAFQAFDVNGDGQISKDELRNALYEAGIPADDETVQRMVRCILSIGMCGVCVV